MVKPTNEQARELSELASRYLGQAIERYTHTALLLNATDLARKYYSAGEGEVLLNPVAEIPPELLGTTNLEPTFTKSDLIRHYTERAFERIVIDFLVSSVAMLDAFFEDLYSLLLRIYRPGISDDDVYRKVRAAWSKDKLRRFLRDEIRLESPEGRLSTIDTALDRYEELRGVRHSLLHRRGQVGEKFLEKSEQARERLRHIPGAGTFLDIGFIVEGQVQPTYELILWVRKWTYEFLGFWHDSLSSWLGSNGMDAAEDPRRRSNGTDSD